jgi:hypothetical protein
MGTQSNVIVGLCDASVKIGTYGTAEGAADDLGYTEGGVELAIAREYFEKTVDQELGVLDAIKTAERATLKVTLAEATLENLAKAIDYPSSAIAGGVLSFGGSCATNHLTIYLNVVAPSGGTRKYTFHKAVCISAATHSYKKDDKTMVECEFLILQDTAKTSDQQMASIEDTGSDSTPPTVLMTTPSPAGTVTKDTSDTIVLTFTEANSLKEDSLIYGDTIQIMNTTVASEGLVAGSIVYNAGAKTITFTPSATWTASDTLLAIVSTGVQDQAGNNLASTYTATLSVTA